MAGRPAPEAPPAEGQLGPSPIAGHGQSRHGCRGSKARHMVPSSGQQDDRQHMVGQQVARFQTNAGPMAVPRYLGTHAAALNLDLLDAAGLAMPAPNCSDHEMATLGQALTRRGTHGRGQVAGTAGLKGRWVPASPIRSGSGALEGPSWIPEMPAVSCWGMPPPSDAGWADLTASGVANMQTPGRLVWKIFVQQLAMALNNGSRGLVGGAQNWRCFAGRSIPRHFSQGAARRPAIRGKHWSCFAGFQSNRNGNGR